MQRPAPSRDDLRLVLAAERMEAELLAVGRDLLGRDQRPAGGSA